MFLYAVFFVFNNLKEFAKFHIKGVRNLCKGFNICSFFPTFYFSQMTSINAGKAAEHLLGLFAVAAQTAYDFSDLYRCVFHPENPP